MLYEYEAAKLEARRPPKTCGTHLGDQIIPELDFDDSFNFLEKYCMDDTDSLQPMRGGYLPPDDTSYDDEHYMEIDAFNAELHENGEEDADDESGTMTVPLRGGYLPPGDASDDEEHYLKIDAFDAELNEDGDDDADEETETMTVPLRGGGPLNGRGGGAPNGKRRGREIGKAAPTLGDRNQLLNECEVYVDVEDRSDFAIKQLCFINACPACLDKFKSPQEPSGELIVDKLRPHLRWLIESVQLRCA